MSYDLDWLKDEESEKEVQEEQKIEQIPKNLSPEEQKIEKIEKNFSKEIVESLDKTIEKEFFNSSLELNLIKSIYANRFGSTTNKTKAHMIKMIKNAL